jgi:putative ABC transport system substrate-binding protein
MPVIGFLNSTSAETNTERLRVFRQALKDSGYIEGENLAIEYRWADNQNGRLPELAAEMVRRKVDAIVATGGTLPAVAAKAATATIPIVFGVGDDPIKLGLVASLRPARRQRDRHQFFSRRADGKAARIAA